MRFYRPLSSDARDRDPVSHAPYAHSSLGAARLRDFVAMGNLVAYWRLENDGVDSVGGYDLSASGTVRYGAGKNNTGLVLAGAGHMVRGYTADLNPAQITVAGWAKWTLTRQYSAIAAIWPASGNDATNSYIIDDDSGGGRICFGVVIGGTAKSALSTASYNDGNWHLFVGTHDEATVKLYVDGDAEIISTAAVGARQTPASELTIGSIIGTSYRWTGSIDEVAIWNKALTADEVLALYNSGAGLFY